MKKKTSKTKLHFRRYKGIYALAILGIVLVWFFVALWLECIPLSSRKLENLSVYVEHTTYVSPGRNFVVRSNGESYMFPHIGHYTEYTTGELGKLIQKGNILHITYLEDRWFFGLAKRNLVVEAHTDEVQLRTIEGYMECQEEWKPLWVVFFVIVEVIVGLLYSLGVFAYFRSNRKYFAKLRKERKKRREKEKKKKNKE